MISLVAFTQYVLILIFGVIVLLVWSATGGDRAHLSPDVSTPQKDRISASRKRTSRKSKTVLERDNRHARWDDDKDLVFGSNNLDGVQKALWLAPSPYKGAEDHAKSNSTRKPGVYDRHLDVNLRPTTMAYCPDIPMKLFELANSRCEEYKRKLGSPPKCDETDFEKIRERLQGENVVRSENGIILRYADTMGKAILPIVSALAFETPSWKQRYIEWSMDLKKDRAISDASLRVNPRILPREDKLHDCRCSRTPEKPSVRKKRPSAVVELDGPKCHICDNPCLEKMKDVSEYFKNIVLFEFKSLVSGTREHLTALLEQTCNDDVYWEECDEKSCSHPRLDPPESGSPTGFDAENPVILPTTEDWGDPLVTLRDSHRASAKYMIQQIWSEMVKNDATFLVLNSGNFEIIALRNRKKRSLHLSGVIDTTAPGYFGLHVGLFLAAIQDAMDRAAQLKASELAKALPSSWLDYIGDRHIRVFDIDTGPIDIEEALSNYQNLCLVPQKGPNVIPYRVWNQYERRPKEQLEGSGFRNFGPLIIRTRTSDDLNVCVGTVEFSGKAFEDHVIVKVARGKRATEELSMESSVYRSLSGDPQECKIPRMYGFFVEKEEPNAILLLKYAGEPWCPLSHPLSDDQWRILNRTRNYMRKRNYEYGGIDNKSVVIAHGAKGAKSDVFLVGLSKCVRSSVEKNARQGLAKRPEISIHLGPIPNPGTLSAAQVFKEVTAWRKSMKKAAVPRSVRCLGWVDNSPDWLDIAASEEEGADRFEELWKRRPDDTHLRKIVCMVYKWEA